MKFFMCLSFCLLIIGLGAVTINIPEDYATIQEGIDASVDGDSVLVAPGIYYENILCQNKSITIGSWYCTTRDTIYISQTVIDGRQLNRVIELTSNSCNNQTLAGFTIQNGFSDSCSGILAMYSNIELEALVIRNNLTTGDGGGLSCFYNQSLTMTDILITENSSLNTGGGLCLGHSSDVVMTNMEIRNNITSGDGGGMSCYSSDFMATNFEIYNNYAGGDGGGIYISGYGDISFHNSRIHDNEASGYGGGISYNSANGEFFNILIYNNYSWAGGGVNLENLSNPDYNQVKIYGNSADRGGGMYLNESMPVLKFTQVRDNTAEFGGGMYLDDSQPVFDPQYRSSIYLNHIEGRNNGLEIYSDNNVEVLLDTFTVAHPTGYHLSPYDNFTINIWHSVLSQVNADLYVSPEGDNSNSGLVPEEALQNIDYANSIIMSDIASPKTIYLSDGIYSNSTNNDIFPIYLSEYVSIVGESSETVILDAEGSSGVIKIDDVGSISITGMTIRNGIALRGGGINLNNTVLNLDDVKIIDNYAEELGGGLYLNTGGQVTFNDLEIRNNYCGYLGGGIYSYMNNTSFCDVLITENFSEEGAGVYSNLSTLNLSNVTLSNNCASVKGGGIYITNNTILNFNESNRCNIYSNNIEFRGLGCDIYSNNCNVDVIVDTFSVMSPTSFHLSPIENYSWDIHHQYHQSIASDLYVSVSGDDNNAGLSWEESFKTIFHACSVIIADINNPRIIHVSNGIYSNSLTGERLPLCLPDYVTISGESENGVILDGENRCRVLRCEGDIATNIRNLTVVNGNEYWGGGIYCINSEACFENVTVSNCHSSAIGGGIYLDNNSHNRFMNVDILNNSSNQGGGIGCGFNSSAIFENLIIRGNEASLGGGLFCSQNNYVQINEILAEENVADINGGAIYCDRYLDIYNGVIKNNNSAYSGGGIYCINNEFNQFKNIRFINNQARSGGGICCVSDSTSIDNCFFWGNMVTEMGAGLFVIGQQVYLRNLTVTENTSSLYGGGIYYCGDTDSIILNSIIWDNEPSEIHICQAVDSLKVMMGYSDFNDIYNNLVIEGDPVFELVSGNISQDPVFNYPPQGSFILAPYSPCIDAGTAYYEYEGEVLIDLDEDEYYGTAPDMGAFEYGLVEIDEPTIQNSKPEIHNYPNPFNPETRIIFDLPQAEKVNLSVYNLKGQLVKILSDVVLPAGENRIIWDGGNKDNEKVSSGVYFIRLRSENEIINKKVMLIK